MSWWDKYQPWKAEPTRGRWKEAKGYYKRRRKQPKKKGEKKAKNQSLPVRAKEKDFLSKHGSLLCDYHKRHDSPLSDDQDLAFQHTLYKFYCLGL